MYQLFLVMVKKNTWVSVSSFPSHISYWITHSMMVPSLYVVCNNTKHMTLYFKYCVFFLANPPKIVSFTPLHAEIHLNDTHPNSSQIDYTCTVSGDLPITVNWYYQYYNSSTPKKKPIDSRDYGSLVIITEDLKPSKHVQEIEMISSEVLTSSYQSKITIKELNISKNGHYICIASNAYGKDLKHGFLFISG